VQMGMYTAMMDEIEKALERAKVDKQVFVEVTRSGKVIPQVEKKSLPEPEERSRRTSR
jgi:hypothetical protein